MNSTKDVIENHIGRFREGNIDGVLDDFSPNAILLTSTGPLRGRSEIQGFFQNLLAEFGKPGASDTVHTACFGGGVSANHLRIQSHGHRARPRLDIHRSAINRIIVTGRKGRCGTVLEVSTARFN